MGKISFSVSKSKSRENASIYLRYNCADGRLKYYTGEIVDPRKWKAGTHNNGIKAQLTRIQQTAEQLIIDYKIKNLPVTRQILKLKLDSTHKAQKVAKTDFFEQCAGVIKKMEEGKIVTPRTRKRYSKGTIKGMNHTARILQGFNPGLSQDSVTLETYKEFITYCHSQDYSTNYIGGQIKNWKTLGKAIGGNLIYDDPGFKILSEESFDIYLDEQEIKKIYELDLTGPLALTRDWFIIGCYTGLRVSDLSLLTKKNYSKGMITIATEKTDEKVVVPIHPFVKSILSKYKGFPPRVPDQKLNKRIKTVAKMAGIKGSVLFTITKGGVRKDEYLKKWEMVSMHSGRRSLVTNLLKMGVSETFIKSITGIKSSSTLRRYNKMSSEEAAKIMSEHEFFK